MIPTIIQACSSLERSVGVNVREPASAMTDPTPQPDPWTLERQRLHEWLERNAGPLADLHASAVRLLHDTSFPGRLPLIALAVREIAKGLPGGITERWAPDSLPVRDVPFWRALLAHVQKLFRGHRRAQRALHTVIREWVEVTGWFEDHGRPDEDELRSQFARFEDGLRAIADGFLTTVKEIDRILESGPPDGATLDRLLPLLKGADELRYFFTRIDDPAWTLPLEQHGFFADPPEPVPADDPRMGTYPRWPASRFLARMAGRPEAREEVARIAGKIETSNVLVHEDLADAALRLSPALSAGLVPGLVRGLGPASTSLLPSKLGALAEGLARSGQVAAARRLLGALLVHARVHPLRVSRVLDRHLEGIVAGLGADALLVIGQALDRTIRLSRPGRPEKRKAGQRYLQDHSDVWSPGLQGDAREGAKGRLIATLRGVAERLVEENPAAIQSVVELLERRRWWVFHRLALHVLGRSAWAAPDLVVGRLLDRGLFDGFGREYRLLVRRGFGSLTAAQQSEWLGWIDAGPDPDKMGVDVERRRWQWRRLAPLAGTLPDVWNERAARLVREFGAPPLVEGAEQGATFSVGWPSPLSEEKLRSMSVEELAGFLESWRPTTLDPWVQPQGLAERVTRVVAEDPGRFAERALRFRDLEPTCVRAVLAGLDSALREKRAFEWGPVLELGQWVAQRPIERPEPRWDGWKDPGWGWARGTLTRLLTLGLREAGGPPPTARQVVWGLVEALNRDPRPESRAEALEAAIQYASWVRRGTGEPTPPGGPPDDLPEVRPILDAALASSVAADREELGRKLPSLVLLEESWVRSNLARLFPEGDGAMELWRAAWHGYVQSGAPPEDRVLSVLRGTYRRAIEILGADPEGDAGLGIDQQALAEHLAFFCGRGTLEAQGQEVLLERFLDTAGLKLRRHFFWFVGHSLEEERVDQAVLKRFQALWERRHAGADGNAASRPEMSAFGSWFVAGPFDEAWALEQLDLVLRAGGSIDLEDLVVRRLAEVAPRHPLPTARCLALLAGLRRERASAFGWIEDVKPILAAALRSEDRAARREAVVAFQRLVALGFRAHELVQFSDDLDDPVAVPYFTWHSPMTVAEVRQRLTDASDPERDRLLALVLREAKDRDVWKFTTPEEVVRRWGDVEPHLGGRRGFWALRLNQWQEQGLPVR